MKFQLKQVQTQVGGGYCKSVFPRLDYVLENSESSRSALEWISGKKKIDRYISLVDFMFCEFFPFYRDAFFLYYEDSSKYKLLKDRVSDDQLEEFQNVLLYALTYAQLLQTQENLIPWSAFVGRSKKLQKKISDLLTSLIE